MKHSTRLLAALVLALLALNACRAHTYPPGPAGTVIDRSAAYFKSGGWRYRLTVGGDKFRVTRDDYRRCFRNSLYPACTNR